MSVDTIGNFLTTIRNAAKLGKRFAVAPYSKMNESIAKILKNEGFVQDVVVEGEGAIKSLKVFLRYVQNESAIHAIDRISTPGRRCYTKATNIQPVKGNIGISILTTNRGLMTDKQAKDMAIGGEIVCSVW
ncbi:MAG: 30S ribosomal protein S8 [Candidatus Babeliales bacterium]